MFNSAAADKYYKQASGSTVKYMTAQVGGLTQTSKMPWLSYSLSAAACNVGSQLRDVEGTVCHKCYGCTGFYQMQSTIDAQARRLSILLDNPERWAGYMAALIERKSSNIIMSKRYFRWHDCGDLQGGVHFHAIAWIAMRVPGVSFYLPTKEKWCSELARPNNLIVRHSVPMIGQRAPSPSTKLWAIGQWAPSPSTKLWATVGVSDEGFQCPAKDQGGECKTCRACWSKSIPVINYTEQ